MNYKSITDKRNRLNNLSKEDKILEIKKNLFQELANQGSFQTKYKGKQEKENFRNENINFINSKNSEENKISENDIDKQNNYQNNDININRNYNELLQNNNYNSKFRNNRNKALTPIKSSTKNNNVNDEENDLMYIIAESNKKNHKKKHNINKFNDNNIISCLALPFCQYHKYNIKLPKKYTCNFKNCSCCQLRESRNIPYENNENTKESSREHIYPSLEKKESTNKRYNSVLEKFINKIKKNAKKKEKKKKKKYVKKKVEDNFNIKTKQNNLNKMNNINLNLKKAKYEERKTSYSKSKNDSSKSGDLSGMTLNFQKPDETNVKIPKKIFEESDKSSSKNYSLDFPDDININDESDLDKYKRAVNKKNKESKIHFSVKYYQKLNKSFRIYCDEDNKKKSSPFKAKSKEKKFEFLRYN